MMHEKRAAYVDLMQRYRFIYGMGLQARLETQQADVVAWWALGRLDRPRPSVVTTGLPDRVREIIHAVAQERGVSPADILGDRKTGRIADARVECYRRLRAMSWPGGRPSLAQIGVWMHRDHTTVMHGVNKR